jgi:hypothetical protein
MREAIGAVVEFRVGQFSITESERDAVWSAAHLFFEAMRVRIADGVSSGAVALGGGVRMTVMATMSGDFEVRVTSRHQCGWEFVIQQHLQISGEHLGARFFEDLFVHTRNDRDVDALAGVIAPTIIGVERAEQGMTGAAEEVNASAEGAWIIVDVRPDLVFPELPLIRLLQVQ